VGHEEQQSYEIVGYPVGWVHQGGRRGRGRGQGSRGGRGSSSQGRGQTGAYATRTMTDAGTAAVEECIPTEKTGTQHAVPGLSAEQIQRLLSLIETPKPGYDKL